MLDEAGLWGMNLIRGKLVNIEPSKRERQILRNILGLNTLDAVCVFHNTWAGLVVGEGEWKLKLREA